MKKKCLNCEGRGVLRHYINNAGDYKKSHCPECEGTGETPVSCCPECERITKWLDAQGWTGAEPATGGY